MKKSRSQQRAGSSGAAPQITIGMPVYNEAKHIAETIESILGQTCRDYELIISDNASEDESPQIVESYLRRDPRIRLIRQRENLGTVGNVCALVREGRGKYFVLAGAHDIWSDEAFELLAKALDDHPKAVVAFPDYVRIDGDGQTVPWEHKQVLVDTVSYGDPVRRFNLWLWGSQWPLYSMMRTSALGTTHGYMSIIAPGALLLCELAVLGGFVEVPGAVLRCRQNRPKESRNQRWERYGGVVFGGRKRRFLPYWRVAFAFIYSALTIPLRKRRRWRNRFWLVASSFMSFVLYRGHLLQDLRRLLSFDREK